MGDTYNSFPHNMNAVFAAGLTSPGLGPESFNPGACTVSTKCFMPALFVAWADALAATLPNLRVYRSTAVSAVGRDAATGRVTSVAAVRRTPTAAHPGGWDRLLSASLPDWYSSSDSDFFTKEELAFAVPPNGIVVEGTEFGDVLLLGGLNTTQGGEEVESSPFPARESCGQATTVCFYTSWGVEPAPSPDPWPAGSDGGHIIHYFDTAADLNHSLTWRRSLASDQADLVTPRRGDVSLLNQQNDEDYAYLFMPVDEARATAALGAYAGGVDLTALAIAEARSYYFYGILRDALPHFLAPAVGFFTLNASVAGTQTGLAKMPYLRDTRRASAGIGGFRLCHEFASPNGTGPGPAGCGLDSDREEAALRRRGGAGGAGAGGAGVGGAGAAGVGAGAGGDAGAAPKVGYKWADTVAIGSYDFDIHRLISCALPAYLDFCYPNCSVGLPYYLPWRAMTHADSPNVVLAGKTMAQSFYANAITRLHPSEWSGGAAAGAGAALMAARGWSSADALAHISELQALVAGPAVGNPLEWTGLR